MADEYLWDDDGTDVNDADEAVEETSDEYGTDEDGTDEDPPAEDAPPDLENQNEAEEGS